MASKHFAKIEALFDDAVGTSAAAGLGPAAFVEPEIEGGGIILQPVGDLSPDDAFDYDALTLSSEERSALKGFRQRIVAVLGAAVISAGQDLLEAKQLIKKNCTRGTWSTWLKRSLGVSESTARNYMAAAEWAVKTPTVVELAPAAMYLGAVAPAEVQAEIEKKLAEREPIQAADIKQMIAAYRQATRPDPPLRGTEGERPAPDNDPPPNTDESVTAEGQRAEVAARELLARLREQFDDTVIADLIKLIDRTSTDTVRKILVEDQRGL
jgi:hypothetical protein